MPFPLTHPQSLTFYVGKWASGAQTSQGNHGVAPGKVFVPQFCPLPHSSLLPVLGSLRAWQHLREVTGGCGNCPSGAHTGERVQCNGKDPETEIRRSNVRIVICNRFCVNISVSFFFFISDRKRIISTLPYSLTEIIYGKAFVKIDFIIFLEHF